MGWELRKRGRDAIAQVRAQAWEQAIDGGGELRERSAGGVCASRECGHRTCWVEEAHVTELTAVVRGGRAGLLGGWPGAMRVVARRERPHPGARLTLVEAGDGWRYSLWATNRPKDTKGWRGQLACTGAAHRVHARVEDGIRAGKNTGTGELPSRDMAMNKAWLTAALLAAALIAWLKLIALDGDLARGEPKTVR